MAHDERAGSPTHRRVPSVLHVDMDAFYAAVEQRHKPSLRGKPVVVGGIGPRGVVSTASYEARAFGVRSAMATAIARQLCPNAAYLAPRFGAYQVVSGVIMAELREVSPAVEPLSLDEAFVDLDAMPVGPPVDADTVAAIAERLRARITEATGLTASVGAGTSKLVAKVASDADKPNGLVIVDAGSEQAWLDPLPVRALWGVGPATAERLRQIGVTVVAELRELSLSELVALLGQAHGGSLFRLARGADERRVEPDRELKSISVEDTFATDLVDPAATRAELNRIVDRVLERLRRSGRSGRTVTLKLRGADFTTLTRSETFGAPTDEAGVIRAAALRLLVQAGVPPGGVRLLGVGISSLAEYSQPDLFGASDEPTAQVDESDGLSGAPAPGGLPDGGDAAPPPSTTWRPGQDVRHTTYGPGWVQGSGLGRVTVRFESPGTNPAVDPVERPGQRVRTLASDDADLVPVDDAEIARTALAGAAGQS